MGESRIQPIHGRIPRSTCGSGYAALGRVAERLVVSVSIVRRVVGYLWNDDEVLRVGGNRVLSFRQIRVLEYALQNGRSKKMRQIAKSRFESKA